MSEKSRSRGCFDQQYGKRAQALLKSGSKHIYQIHSSLPRILSWKKSLFLTCKFLRLLVKTFGANEKYLAEHSDNLTIPFQMQLSQKQKTFSEFFDEFLKSTLNFKHFARKDDLHSFCIFEGPDSANLK